MKALTIDPDAAAEALTLAARLVSVAERQAEVARDLLGTIDLTGEIELGQFKTLVSNQREIHRLRSGLKRVSGRP